MTTEPHTVSAILDLWGSDDDVAADLSVRDHVVRDWRRRGSIPAKYDLALCKAARMRNLPLTLEVLALARSFRAQTPEVA
jgi:hypothetical protein